MIDHTSNAKNPLLIYTLLNPGKAANKLALEYAQGLEGNENRQPDYNKAKKLFKIAIQYGEGEAAYNLAFLYMSGALGKKGVSPYQKMQRLYEVAIDLGVVDAYYNLGVLYRKGLIGKKDSLTNINKARECLEAIVELDDDGAAANGLAAMYAEGLIGKVNGVVNFVKAEQLYKSAINKGNIFAMKNLGVLYLDRNINFSEAMVLLKKYILAADKSVEKETIVCCCQKICVSMNHLRFSDDTSALKMSWDSFFKENFDLTFKDENQNTLLHCALLKGYKDFARYLIENGIELNAINVHNQSALRIAREKNYSEIVEIIEFEIQQAQSFKDQENIYENWVQLEEFKTAFGK